jgi:hypothetical protein
MKVQLTPAALREINVLRTAGYKGAGFLLGSVIGRFIIIDQLMALDFNRDSADDVYSSVCASYQQRLQGVFFCRRRPFTLDWFLHDVIMLIKDDQIEILGCEFSVRRQKSVLVSLLESKEGQWQI